MHLIEEHYYTINKVFLKMLGMWPYDRSRLALLQQFLVSVITITYTGMQFSVLITTKYSVALFIKIMSFVIPFTIIVMKYYVFILKSTSIQNLHYHIREDWKIIRNKLESKIILEYAHYSQILTIFLFLFIDFVLIVIVIIQFLPNILDVVLPLDKPRPRKLIFMVEYFVFQDKYFYIKVLHQFMCHAVYGSIMFATVSQLLIFCCYSFGMFKIASHRIEHSIEEYVLHVPNSEKKYAIYKRIVHAVIAHRRVMEFSNMFVSSINAQYCIIVIFGVISLSINLYGIVEAATVSKNMENLLICFINVLAHLIYMFMANYIGQKFIDYNSDLFKLIYGTSWYLMPVSSQKLILFLMQKTGKDFYLMIGLIFVAKMESFAMLVNLSLSYVAVMYSRMY